jgi:hypothetical protein
MRERAQLLGGSFEAARTTARSAFTHGSPTARCSRERRSRPRPPVDDDDLMGAGLKAVLSSDATIEVVGEADDGRAVLEQVRALSPDVTDVRMPDLEASRPPARHSRPRRRSRS